MSSPNVSLEPKMSPNVFSSSELILLIKVGQKFCGKDAGVLKLVNRFTLMNSKRIFQKSENSACYPTPPFWHWRKRPKNQKLATTSLLDDLESKFLWEN